MVHLPKGYVGMTQEGSQSGHLLGGILIPASDNGKEDKAVTTPCPKQQTSLRVTYTCATAAHISSHRLLYLFSTLK